MINYVRLDSTGAVTGGGSLPSHASMADLPDDDVLFLEGDLTFHDVRDLRYVNGLWVERTDIPADPPPSPTAARDLAVYVATKELMDWLDHEANNISGIVPQAERATWDAKNSAVHKIKEGKGTPADYSFIQIESAIVGEELSVTLQKIETAAAMFHIAGPLITGLRRRAAKKFQECKTPEDVSVVMEECKTIFISAISDPINFASDPIKFLEGFT